MKKLKQSIIFSLIVISLSIVGCSHSDAPDILEISGQTMGTWYSVKMVDLPKAVNTDQVSEVIQWELDNVNDKMSTYQPGSELSKLNRAAVSEPFTVSEDTFEVLSKSLEIWRLSEGAFDITVGPLVNLWGFGPENRPHTIPDPEAMKKAWNRVGSDGLSLHIDDFQVEKSKDLYLDLSAIAKGYAVDRVAQALEDLGVRRYMVEVGGEIKVGNNKAHNLPWQVAVEEPVEDLRRVHRVLKLNNVAMATSGDYRNYYEFDGKRYSHTIDPRNGQPIDHRLVSATVIMPQCASADAWATAMMVLGPKQGMEVAEANHLAVYLILKTEKGLVTHHSTAFKQYMDQ
ncbi:FAD:protein FMN transferase [Ketobacter sp. MCCC 1A13808]|uniref:FAD:protein FMN transferase n=1 Tax=Ketobacter sp. MCCC 1A13808 TaxID=2602738 RepID=UPI000F2D3254|nr:FAD:protein FMN transferase [Ketobacter sp. MCCC 1A13808]MVF10717.1 FAD:protein FMN transferase [Ketobacter sp. MCCC 1A13808]RLP56135.1 MAG: FAD:protein FMN transferase [Ketobacter sp.]